MLPNKIFLTSHLIYFMCLILNEELNSKLTKNNLKLKIWKKIRVIIYQVDLLNQNTK